MVSGFERAVRAHAVGLMGEPFDRLLAQHATSVAFVGESHHFVRETYEVRTRVLVALAALGYTRFGVEIARTDGARLDEYLRIGAESVLDLVATFGYRTELDREYEGVLATPPGSYPTAGLRNAYTTMLDRLRAPSTAATPWSMFGFDVDYTIGVAAERLATLADPIERDRAERTLLQSRRYDAAVRSARSYEDLREPMAWREELMVEHVEHELARLPGESLALCGHNLHLAKNVAPVEIEGGVGPGGGRVAPLGGALIAAGVEACGIWLLHDHGADSGPPPSDGTIRSQPGSLNAALARCGEAFAISTHDVEAFERPWPIAGMYNSTTTVVPRAVCDIIVFVARTSRL